MNKVGLGSIASELQKSGLLLDTEADPTADNGETDENTK